MCRPYGTGGPWVLFPGTAVPCYAMCRPYGTGGPWVLFRERYLNRRAVDYAGAVAADWLSFH